MWLSLVERLVWDQDAAGSNPVNPPIDHREIGGLFVYNVFLQQVDLPAVFYINYFAGEAEFCNTGTYMCYSAVEYEK